jgi:hypothetical protein
MQTRQLKTNLGTALALFRGGAVSAGFAARLADKPLPEMLTLLLRQGIPLTGPGQAAAAEVRDDMRRARDGLASR